MPCYRVKITFSISLIVEENQKENEKENILFQTKNKSSLLNAIRTIYTSFRVLWRWPDDGQPAETCLQGKNRIFFSSLISNQSTRYSTSWCAGWLTWWSPLQRDLLWVQSLLIEILAPRRLGFYLKSKSTNYPDHGHHEDPTPTREIPMVELGIEPGTSWLVARSSDP
jgi:hypothetical protein